MKASTLMLYGYRKAAVSVVGILAGSILSYLGHLDTAAAGLIGTIVAAYLASNVGTGRNPSR